MLATYCWQAGDACETCYWSSLSDDLNVVPTNIIALKIQIVLLVAVLGGLLSILPVTNLPPVDVFSHQAHHFLFCA